MSTVGVQPLGPVIDASAGNQFQTGVTTTTYNGMPAYRIQTSVKQLTIPNGQSLPNPLDYTENGVLLAFTVAVNDPLFEVDCVVYGQDNSPTILNDTTMQQVTSLGRGLTQGQAESVGPQGQSLDQQTVKDDTWPYIQRYRHTYSLQAILANATYAQVAGTLDDEWIVLNYSPNVKEGYTRFFLDVTNTSANDRMIHLLQVSRIKYQNAQSTMYNTGSANLAQELRFG